MNHDHAGSLLLIPVVSRTEILSGARNGEEDTIQDLFAILTSADVEIAIADRAGEYLRDFSKSNALGIGDAIIAFTCKSMEWMGVKY